MDTYRAVDPAEAEPQDTTSRTQQETTAPRKNLDDDPDFRKWKSLRDRQDEELRRQLADEHALRRNESRVAERSENCTLDIITKLL